MFANIVYLLHIYKVLELTKNKTNCGEIMEHERVKIRNYTDRMLNLLYKNTQYRFSVVTNQL